MQREIAHTLQQSLLPGTLAAGGRASRLAARYRPSGEGAEVGGDFYDAWPIDGGDCAVAIGDVAGKGPGAAALTALTRHAMRVASRYERSPSRILEVVNETILGQARGAEFCTALVALIAPDDDGATLTSACAGHAPPLILRGGSGAVEEAGAWGTLLGAVPETTFTDVDGAPRARRQRHLLDGRRHRAARRRRAVRRGAAAGAGRLAGRLRRRDAGRAASTTPWSAYAPGLPDDDVAILAVHLLARSRVDDARSRDTAREAASAD